MPVFLVTYDFRKKGSSYDYKPFYDELERAGGHRTMPSAWLVPANHTPREVLYHLRQFLDAKDRLWVTRIRKGEYYYIDAYTGTNDWLKENPAD